METVPAVIPGEEVKVEVPAELTMEEIANGTVQPVTTPVEAPVIPTEGATPTPVVTPEDAAQDAIQKRINKITADKYAEKRRADELQTKLAALDVAKPALPDSAPDIEDFDFDEDKHQEALIQYQVQYQVQKALEAQKEVAVQQQVVQSRQKVADDFTSKEAEYLVKHPEYAEEVSNLPMFNQDTLSAIYELGPQVSHYLAKHLDIAGEVANASSTMAAVKLGQISMGLSADSKKVTPSAAPVPVTTLNGGGAVNKSMDEMSMDEIMGLP